MLPKLCFADFNSGQHIRKKIVGLHNHSTSLTTLYLYFKTNCAQLIATALPAVNIHNWLNQDPIRILNILTTGLIEQREKREATGEATGMI